MVGLVVVTVNLAWAESRSEGVNVTTYGPTDEPAATMKEAKVIVPLAMLHVGLEIMLDGLLVIEAPVQVSVGAKPLPVMETCVPTEPEFGISVIVGAAEDVNVNVADAESPVLGSKVTVYGPGLTFTAVNDAEVIVPPSMLHKASAISPVGLLEKELGPQVSVGLNPLPVTVTTVPTLPDDGVNLIVAIESVNVAWAESRVLPTSTTVY
jgi:hypothetical protein